MTRSTVKLTKRAVDAMPIPERGRSWLWDREVRGFGVRASSTGRKVYKLRYRPKGQTEGASHDVTIGRHGDITVEQARALALTHHGSIAAGKDPARERASLKTAPTIEGLSADYLASLAGKRTAGTVREYARQFGHYITPKLGRSKVADVTRSQVALLHQGLRETPYMGNRVLATLSSFFTWATRQGFTGESNPCKYVERYPEEGREFFLDSAQSMALGAALKTAEAQGIDPIAIAAIRFLALTGLRCGEALSLRRDDIDEELNIMRLRDTKTGKSNRQLSAAAKLILPELPSDTGNPHVFPGAAPGSHLTTLKRPWHLVRRLAGLPHLRLHDLRHSFASDAVSSGTSLPMIAALLGHLSTKTTERYAHVANDPKLAAANRTAESIAAKMAGQDTPVTPLRLTVER